MIRRVLFILLVSFLWLGTTALLQAGEPEGKVELHFFWGQGCPHCEHEKVFLESLKKKYPELVVHDHEVWHNGANKDIYRKMSEAYGADSGAVPSTFIDVNTWLGYNDEKGKEIDDAVARCLRSGCLDPLMVMAQGGAAGLAALQSKGTPSSPEKVRLPWFGDLDTARISLPLLTVILAGLDGFNPCAFFVLLMLLSLMVHAQSRVRMLVVGGVFVFFSGFVYFLFMAAWLNLFMVTGKVGIITTVAGALAVVMAFINIKDYFYFKQGVSLTISKEAQASLTARMRGLIKTGSVGGLILGTVVLAVIANMYELLCTAGFPMVFTRALTLQQLSTSQYYLYLVLYNVIYVIPLLAIVVFFAWTLGSRKLTEEEGRILKLVSGLMMLGLGGMLVFRPELLNSVVVSAGLIVLVLGISGLIVRYMKGRTKAHGR